MRKIIEFYAGVVTLSLLLSGCPSKDSGPVSAAVNNTNTGKTKTYSINASSFVSDEITGLSFSATDVGSGSIVITQVKSAEGITESDSAFSIEYNGTGFAQVKIPIQKGMETYLMGYADYAGLCFYNSISNSKGWLPMPVIASDANSKTYLLPLPNSVAKANGNMNIQWSGVANYRVINRQASDKTAEIEKQVNDALDKLMNIVPDKLLAEIKTKKDTTYKHSVYVETSNIDKQPCYIPYMHVFKITISRYLLACQIVINFLNTKIDDKSVAHETGHHLYHMLMGSDYVKMKALPSDHGIGSPGTRNNLIEELSHISEYYIKGKAASLNPENPYNMFSSDPASKDFPDREGFLTMMAASIIRTNRMAKNFDDEDVELPVILPAMKDRTPLFKDIVQIFADEVNSITEFRDRIENLLQYKYSGADKFPIILQSIGWSYKVKFQVVDKNGNNLSGVTARSTSNCTSELKTYMLPLSTNPSDGSGILHIERVYPGKNFIRFYFNKDSVDKEFTLKYSNPTNVEVDLGKVIIDKGMEESNKFYMGFYGDVKLLSSYSGLESSTTGIDFINFAQLQNKPEKPLLKWSGNSFSYSGKIVLTNNSDYLNTINVIINGNLNSTGSAIEKLEYTDTVEHIWPQYPQLYWREAKNIIIKNLPLQSSYSGYYNFQYYGANTEQYFEKLVFERYYKDIDQKGTSATLKLTKVNWTNPDRIPELKVQFLK